MLNPEDGAMLLRQVNMLTSGSFGGDTNALEQSKIYYRGQIEKLMENQQAFASNNADKSAAILRSTTGGKPGGQLITVQPTYGGYFQSYVYPVIGLMALGGVLAVMKMRSGSKIKTEPVSIDTPKKSKKSLYKFSQ